MRRVRTRPAPADLRSSILGAWRTNCRVTSELIAGLPARLWNEPLPGAPRRTVRMLAVHLHNARARWIRTLGGPHGVVVPPLLDRRRAGKRDLLAALKMSDAGIAAVLTLGLDADNTVPATPLYAWRNLPLDVAHVLAYFVAHEAHHRGQLVMIARELGQRLPPAVTDGLWQWSRLQ